MLLVEIKLTVNTFVIFSMSLIELCFNLTKMGKKKKKKKKDREMQRGVECLHCAVP